MPVGSIKNIEEIFCDLSSQNKNLFSKRSQVQSSEVQGCLACGWVTFFILLDIVDEPMNGSSYAQCVTPLYLKNMQFSSVNLEP